MVSNTLTTAWHRQKDWSQIADRLKRSLLSWRKVVLALTVFAAVAGTACTLLKSSRTAYKVAAAFAAVAAGVAPVIARMRLDQEHTEQWIRARSASEAYKAEIYRYRTGTGGYGEPDRHEALGKAIAEIDASVSDIIPAPESEFSPTADQTSDLSIADYLEKRVTQQIAEYYRPKAAFHTCIAQRYRNIHLGLMLFGALLGGISAATDVGLGPWVAVVTTITSSILAHSAAGRHDYLAISFRATANRLEEIQNAWLDGTGPAEPTPGEKTKLVSDCEDVISNENQSWHAKFTKPVAADSA